MTQRFLRRCRVPSLLIRLAFLCIGASTVVAPANTRAQTQGDAVFLYYYRIKPGMTANFTEGYRRHLEWHRQKSDSLDWLAWTVFDGNDVGLFVDGTFGIPFSAFDARVDPRGDAEDASRNVTPFADAVRRQVLRLRRDLGGSFPLERAKAAAMQQVITINVNPSQAGAFEREIGRLLSSNRDRYAIYQVVSGGDPFTYVIIVQMPTWSTWNTSRPDLLLTQLSAIAPRAVSIETWTHRADLTYIFAARR